MRSSSGWGGSLLHCGGVFSTLSFTASIEVQNKAAGSTYSMGMKRWNPTRLSSVYDDIDTIKATEEMSYMRTQIPI